MVIGVTPYLVPLMFQEGFGLNPFESGILFLSTMAGNLAMKPATIWVMRHYNFRTVLIVNGFLVSLFTFLTSLLLPQTPTVLIVTVMFLSGMFRSMQFSAITTLAFADVPQPQMTPANTLYSTVQQMSTGLGIAMGAVFLRFSNLINNGEENDYAVSAFHLSFIFVAIFGIISLYDYIIFTTDSFDVLRLVKRDSNGSK